jgi:hypothetical protein
MKNWTLDQLSAKGVKFTVYGGNENQQRLPGVVAHPPVPEKRKNKFNAKKTERHGRVYDSIAEADRAEMLIWLERAHSIRGLGFQPVYALPGGIRYVGDFAYFQNGRQVCEDVKSPATLTAAFRLKRRLFLETYPAIDLRVVDGRGNPIPIRSCKQAKREAA